MPRSQPRSSDSGSDTEMEVTLAEVQAAARQKQNNNKRSAEQLSSSSTPETEWQTVQSSRRGGAQKKTRSEQQDVEEFRNEVINEFAEMRTIIGKQGSEIDKLKQTVQQQQKHIETLLSLLGLDKIPDDTLSSGQPSSQQSQVPTTSNTNQPSSAPSSYATATARNIPPIAKQLKQAVVSAVYSDLHDRDRRARNVVISGLKHDSSSPDDVNNVRQFVEREFGAKPEIVRCRRLGKQQPGKIQPLLVNLKTVTEASNLVENARQLRHSADPHVRQSVFVNADLTKAEALAAYRDRCERRNRAAN